MPGYGIISHYPENPNGSKNGIAAVVSDDGRNLAIMPHPERSFLKWQIPWINYKDIYNQNEKLENFTPWFKIFVNCRYWLESIHK